MNALLALVLAGALAVAATAGAEVWPDREWATATPESQGMDPSGVGAAADYAQKHGGQSGCVIRYGYLIREWGSPTALADIKSATKGSVGTTLLGLAVDDRRVSLDERATRYYPALGREAPGNAEKGWLEEVTVRQLATMTAGFDDGRPPKLVYRPGTSGIYSNDTANMLAELLTLTYKEDLRDILKRRVMDPIGAAPSEWRWRDNAYRADTVGGLKSREFASGITITHRALARIGYLYLHEGQWKGRRILSREFVRQATHPAARTAPWPYYAFYWGSNALGTYAGIPRDTFWALGLGDSFVAVCPSLDLVAVRLGVGSTKSQLPEPKPGSDDWGGRVAGFLRPLVAAVQSPYPPSPVITGLEWAPASTIRRAAKDSDNWPLTWADDGDLYTAYGDGRGFEPGVPEKLSLGLAKVSGPADRFQGSNLRSATGERKGDGRAGEKASGLLMVDGALYLWVRNAGNARLGWSLDRGKTWVWADWRFTQSFGCPTFLNFGRNYAGARDGYVYVYSPDAEDAYTPADRMVLARVPRDRIADRSAYEFLQGVGAGGAPEWTRDIAERGAVFSNPGRCYRSGISYNAGLRRYLWCQVYPGSEDLRFRGGFGVFDAPEPWGPWSTVYTTREWDVGPGESSSFPTKWMSRDGRRLYLVFSGDDSFSVRRATLLLAGDTQVRPAPVRGGRASRQTRVSLQGGRWYLNGRLTYPGAPAEGLLMNVRMVNAVFEDRKRPDFDPEANTREFLRRILEYVAQGVRAFTVNLQGGMPGYEGAVNTAFEPDGSLRQAYLQRVRSVVETCDRRGAVVILGCFYQRQDQTLRDGASVRAAVRAVARWVRAEGFTNVLLEIANEFGHGGYDHSILRTAGGQVELMELARHEAPGLLVSTSGLGGGTVPEPVACAADFILVHFNGTPVGEIAGRVKALKPFGKPIVCNEDAKEGEEGARAAEASVRSGASWGLMLESLNQRFPFTFGGASDDPVIYGKLRELTSRR